MHSIFDSGARHLMVELCERAHRATARPALLIAESDLNDPKVVRPGEVGGWGFDAQWADVFHHALHALLTGESDGYYAPFGTLVHLVAASQVPFVDPGGYSGFRRRRHGAPADDQPPPQFVVYSQDHDQVGNRAMGDRPPRRTRAPAAMWVLLSPFTPMPFMGEEHGEEHLFGFFTDHVDHLIAEATREGRRHEFGEFAGFRGEPANPQDPETLARSAIGRAAGNGAVRELYRHLLTLRRELPQGRPAVAYHPERNWIAVHRGATIVVGNFGDDEAEVPVDRERLVLATAEGFALSGGRLRLPAWAGAVER